MTVITCIHQEVHKIYIKSQIFHILNTFQLQITIFRVTSVYGDINFNNPIYYEYKNIDTVVLTYSWIKFSDVPLFLLYAFTVFRSLWHIQLPRSVQSLKSVCLMSVLTVQNIRVLLKFLSNWQIWHYLTSQNCAAFSILHFSQNKFHEVWGQQLGFWTVQFLCIRLSATTYW